MIPRKPQHGDPISVLPGILGTLIDHVRSITPMPSATIGLSRFSSGTTFHVKSRPAEVVREKTGSPSNFMFTCTAVLDEHNQKWAISTLPGTAQPLYGQIQVIQALERHLVEIPTDGFALVYATLYIYKDGEYLWEWKEELDVVALGNAGDIKNVLPKTWEKAYQSIAIIDHKGNVTQGHEGALVLPVPKSIVDLEPPDSGGNE
jgi:hypothetical protein